MNPRRFPAGAANREWILLGLITLGGLLLRLAAWSSQILFTGNTVAHAALAGALAGGPSLAPIPPPGTALVWWPLGAVFPGPEAGEAASLIGGVLLVPAVFLLARALGAGFWALVPAVAVAVLPPFLSGSLLPGPQSLFALAVAASLLAARRGWILGGGAVMGVAFLFRPEALALALVGAAWLRRPSRALRWLGGFALVALPALGVVRAAAGQWGWADPNFPFLGPRWWEEGGRSLEDAIPYLALLGVAAAWALARIRAPRLRRIAGWALVGAALVGAGVARKAPAATGSPQDLEIAKAGQWLRSNVKPETKVVAPGLLAPYQAGARYLPIPAGTYDEILDEIVREGADYLVVDSEVLTAMGTALAPLSLDKPVAWHETRVRPVYLRIRDTDKNTLVFRVVRPGGPEPLSGEETMKGAVGHMNHSENHYFHGVLAERAGAYWVAAGEYEYATLADELDPKAHGGLARCLLLAGKDYARAEEHARSATVIDDTNPEYAGTLADVLRREGKTEEAATWESKRQALLAASPAAAAP